MIILDTYFIQKAALPNTVWLVYVENIVWTLFDILWLFLFLFKLKGEGDPLMWMMPLHVNKKSDYDDDWTVLGVIYLNFLFE